MLSLRHSRPSSLYVSRTLGHGSRRAPTARAHEMIRMNIRSFAREAHPKPLGGSSRSSLYPYFTGLLVLGAGLTAYGLFSMFNIMTMWPPEVRKDLRSGLLAKRKGDLDVAASYLSRAWEQTKAVPLSSFGEEPLLKVTGVAIALASVLEEANRPEEAYKVYADGLLQLSTAYLDLPRSSSQEPTAELAPETLKRLSTSERIRAVAIAYKLGELANQLRKPLEEEKWLVWSVETMLKTMKGTHAGPERTPEKESEPTKDELLILQELDILPWTMVVTAAAPFEALASFYARTGNIGYALPLYLHAVSILIPRDQTLASTENKCRGAQIMGNIAEIILRDHPSSNIPPEVLAQAESWAKKGLEIVNVVRKPSSAKLDVCEDAYAVLLYNVAMIRELSGDSTQAHKLFRESLDQSKTIGLQEGIVQAEEALQRLAAGSSNLKQST